PRRPRLGVGPPAPAAGPAASFGSRESVRQRRLPAGAGAARNRLQHEPSRRLLGQCRRRELFRDAEGRAGPRRSLGHSGGGAHRALRVSRALLQWAAAAFGARVSQPPGLRAAVGSRSIGSLTYVSTKSGQVQTIPLVFPPRSPWSYP